MVEAGVRPGIAAGIHDDPGAAVRADVDESADVPVIAARYDQRHVGALDCPEVVDLGHLALVTDEVPILLEDVLAFLGEYLFVVIDATADIMAVGKRWSLFPGLCRS